jgi:hypothetical protein
MTDRSMPALVFLVSNFAGGGLHYLYQVVASRSLDKAAFSAFSFWLANISLGFVLASVAQYVGNFQPTSNSRLRSVAPALGGAVVALSLLAVANGGLSLATVSAMTILSATVNSWLLGQAQNRLLFYTFSTATLLVALCKLAVVWPSFWRASSADLFYVAIVVSYAPSILFLAMRLSLSRGVPSPSAPVGGLAGALGAPLFIASAAAAFPQLDLIVVKATQDAGTFQDFARASLFYKGLYFAFVILLQWMLPYQVRRSSSSVPRLNRNVLFAVSIGSSALIALVAPTVASVVMHWPDAPPRAMIFCSCCNVCLLSWILFLIQEACAHGRSGHALALLGSVGGAYAVVWTLSPALSVYFAIALAANCTTIAIYLARPRGITPLELSEIG